MVIAFWALRVGWTLRNDDRRQGTAMMILAALVFVVRAGLYVFG